MPAIKFEKQVTENFDHLTFECTYTSDEQIDADKVKEQILYKKSIVYGQFLNFLNYFSQIGGFEALVGALKAGNESLEDRMPLDVMSLLVLPFRQCNSVFDAIFKQGFINEVKDILVHRLKTMTEKELKEIDKESVSYILFAMKEFFTLSMSDVETAELIETTQLNMALRFIKSTYLEKRLKGISDIK